MDKITLGLYACGVATGISLGVLLSRKYYEKIANDEIDSVKEAYGRSLDDVYAELSKEEEEEEPEHQHPPKEDLGGADVEAIFFKKHTEIITPYGSLNETGSAHPTVEIIDEDEFYEPEEEYQAYGRMLLTYYIDDDVLVDEQESVITNRDDLIGRQALEGLLDENDSIFVRNRDLDLHIEVVLNVGSYKKLIDMED